MSVESSGLHRSRTESHLLEWQAGAASPPHPGRQLVQYGQSTPTFLMQAGTVPGEGQDTVAFYAPPLHQETLMEVNTVQYINSHCVSQFLSQWGTGSMLVL